MKQRVKSFIKRLVLILLIAFVLGIGFYKLNAKLLLGDSMPMPFGIGTSVVLSGSMEPALYTNDLLIVKRTDTLREGQIVVYQAEDSLTVHRIISIEGEELITKGDANDAPDDPITRDMIKGEVVFAIPYIGFVIKLLQHPIAVILLLAAAVVLFERSYRADKKKSSSELDEIKEEIRELMKEIKEDPEHRS